LPALYSNRDDLAGKLLKISEELNDPMWHMPLWRSYLRFFDTDIADLNNSGRGGFAGSIVAALFLEHFVPGDIPWIPLTCTPGTTSTGRGGRWGEKRRDCGRCWP
jgi:leucyl aminopeptidase